jgi:ribosomal protein L7/L12
VEKAPTDLKKAVKKEEADDIKKKLADNGAVVELI